MIPEIPKLEHFEFWVRFEHSTHTPRCSTPTPRFFVSEFWVCCRVLGSFRTFHTHTTMFNAHPTIFCFRVLGLFASFGFVVEFRVCCRVSGLFRTFHTHTTMFNAHPRVCCRVLVLFGLISPDVCTKKKLNFWIPILISDFLRQMRYRLNRHHS